MAEKEIKLFNIGYSKLIDLCNKTKGFAERDINEFINYGIDQAYLDEFDEEINEFEVFEWDNVKMANQVGSTQEKVRLRDELHTIAKSIAMRGKLAFEVNTSSRDCFTPGSITKLNDSEFLVETRRLKRDAEEYLSELSAFGLTQVIIDDLDAKNTAFENALETQDEAKSSRKEKTAERIAKGNALYRKVRKLCDVGQTIWYETSEARWNDYIYFTGAKYNKKKKLAEEDVE